MEKALGTDPKDGDSDNDGVDDGQEVKIDKTNPLEDGLSDRSNMPAAANRETVITAGRDTLTNATSIQIPQEFLLEDLEEDDILDTIVEENNKDAIDEPVSNGNGSTINKMKDGMPHLLQQRWQMQKLQQTQQEDQHLMSVSKRNCHYQVTTTSDH